MTYDYWQSCVVNYRENSRTLDSSFIGEDQKDITDGRLKSRPLYCRIASLEGMNQIKNDAQKCP